MQRRKPFLLLSPYHQLIVQYNQYFLIVDNLIVTSDQMDVINMTFGIKLPELFPHFSLIYFRYISDSFKIKLSTYFLKTVKLKFEVRYNMPCLQLLVISPEQIVIVFVSPLVSLSVCVIYLNIGLIIS